MKAWRLEAQAINQRIAAGSKEPRSRVQMQQREAISRYYKAKGSGNWLMDGMFLRNGFKRAVYGEPLKLAGGAEVYTGEPKEQARPYENTASNAMAGLVKKFKAWWNKR